MAKSRAAVGEALQPYEIDEFNGLDTLTAPDSVPPGFSPSCQNIDFEGGGKKGGSRSGTSTFFDLTGGTDVFQAKKVQITVPSIRYYLFLMDDHKLYYSTGGARTLLYDCSATSPIGFSTTVFGTLVFIFVHDGNKGLIQPLVWDTTNSTIDLITITAPAKGTFAAADGAAGICTKGTHLFLIIYETRTGYRCLNTLTAQQISLTSAGTVVIGLSNIPVYAGEAGHVAGEVTKRYVAMTAAGGTTFYLVPDSYLSATLLNNATTAVNVNIDDPTLIAGVDVSSYFTFFQATATAGAQVMPNLAKGFIYNNRLMMIGNDGNRTLCYVSELGFPQEVRADIGFLQMSANQTFGITNMFQIRNGFYITCGLGVVGFNDNGQFPNAWPQAPYSDDVGCVSYDAVGNVTDEDFVVIADFKGPYIFTGAPPYQVGEQISPTWATITIANTNQFRVSIDTRNKKIFIFAPTGGATRCNTLFVGSYREGLKKIRWTTWTTAGTAWREVIIDVPNVLFAVAGSTVRLYDSAATSDNGTAINWKYRFEPIWAHGAGQSLTYFDGMYIRAFGVGSLNLRVYDTEGTELAGPAGDGAPVTIPPWTLSATPVSDFYRGFNFTQERLFFEIGQNNASAWCNFSWVQLDIAPDGVRPH